jgi:hypothetical protein
MTDEKDPKESAEAEKPEPEEVEQDEHAEAEPEAEEAGEPDAADDDQAEEEAGKPDLKQAVKDAIKEILDSQSQGNAVKAEDAAARQLGFEDYEHAREEAKFNPSVRFMLKALETIGQRAEAGLQAERTEREILRVPKEYRKRTREILKTGEARSVKTAYLAARGEAGRHDRKSIQAKQDRLDELAARKRRNTTTTSVRPVSHAEEKARTLKHSDVEKMTYEERVKALQRISKGELANIDDD